jgi:hypothetical protein
MIQNIGVQFQLVSFCKNKSLTHFLLSLFLDAKNLIDHLLVVDRHKRMHADEILLHPWIMSVGQSKPIRNTEELKSALRLKYDAKVKEYTENQGP